MIYYATLVGEDGVQFEIQVEASSAWEAENRLEEQYPYASIQRVSNFDGCGCSHLNGPCQFHYDAMFDSDQAHEDMELEKDLEDFDIEELY